MAKIQRALISVTDKSGIVPFARSLYDLSVELVSTGGTAKLIREAGIPVRDVADLTGFPEMLDGRVKTIHPAVAGGVLAVRGNAEHMASIREHNIGLIDMVVVNLYQFEKIAASAEATVPDLIENIDIGGPTMIRAAAKNFQDVAVVTSPDDYAGLISDLRQGNGNLPISRLWELAKKAFANTAAYDRAITARLASIQFIDDDGWQDRPAELPPVLDLRLEQSLPLRYGENPHQRAALYSSGKGGIANGAQLHGKELSYNNLVDLDAAWQLIGEFDRPAAAIIKHTNPCGCSEQDGLADAYRSAFEADPVSAFGGVLAFNRVVDAETAGEISKTFIEAIAAPGFSEGALDLLRTKKNLRLLEVAARPAELAVKSISGGLLAQTPDTHRLERWESKVVSERQAYGRGMGWAGVRLEGLQARKVQRDCVRQCGTACERRRGADEPGGRSQSGCYESGAAACGDGARVRRILSRSPMDWSRLPGTELRP